MISYSWEVGKQWEVMDNFSNGQTMTLPVCAIEIENAKARTILLFYTVKLVPTIYKYVYRVFVYAALYVPTSTMRNCCALADAETEKEEM